MSIVEFDALSRLDPAAPADRLDPAAPADRRPTRGSAAGRPDASTALPEVVRPASRLVVAPAPAPATAPRRLPFVLTLVALLAIGLAGLLVLNTVMAQDAFRASRLAEQSAQLQAQRQALSEQVDRLQSPQSLAQRAAGMGLVRQTDPPILDLGKGTVTASER